MVLWNFDLLWKTIVLCKKLWFYGQKYDSLPRTSIHEGRKHGRLAKTKKRLMVKLLWNYTKIPEVYEQVYSFRTLISYWKTMLL